MELRERQCGKVPVAGSHWPQECSAPTAAKTGRGARGWKCSGQNGPVVWEYLGIEADTITDKAALFTYFIFFVDHNKFLFLYFNFLCFIVYTVTVVPIISPLI